MGKVRIMSLLAVAGMLLAALWAGPAASAQAGPAASAQAGPAASAQTGPAASAQTGVTTWIRAYVDPVTNSPAAFGDDVYPTTDGGYIVTGATGVSPYNAWVGKIAASGAVQWQKQVGCGASTLLSVQQTADGGYILAGGATDCDPQCAVGQYSSLACAWVLKLSSAGAVEWQDVYPGSLQSSANQIRQTSDGGYIVAGSTSNSSGTNYAWIAKLSAQGAVQWQRQIGSSSFAEARTVEQTSDGGYIIAGSTGVIGSSSVLVIKLDASGNIQWQQAYGSGYEDIANSVRQTSDGGYIVAGQVVSESPMQADSLLLKLTSSGTIQWQNRYDAGPGMRSSANSVVQTAAGGYVVAGGMQVIVGQAVAPVSWLAETNASGTISWQDDYYAVSPGTGLAFPSAFSAVAQAGDGGFVAVGTATEYNNTSDNIWLVKTDANGNVAGCAQVHPASATTLSAGLTASAPALGVAVPATAGAVVSGGTTSAALTTHQNC